MRSSKHSGDPCFTAKLADIVGLYLTSPRRAVVLSMDERSQIQALARTHHPLRPDDPPAEQRWPEGRRGPACHPKPGSAGAKTDAHRRPVSFPDIPPAGRAEPNGTATPLDILDGTLFGRSMQRHRHQELIGFLSTIEAAVATGKIVHVILDTASAPPIGAADKHPKVKVRLDRHPRWTFHHTPTAASPHRPSACVPAATDRSRWA
jgi:hypothetical protein